MKISNPLTIIAIFAGLAETLATVALVKLPLEIQTTFVYFVMAFPAGLVILFFGVLYFKNEVLYAPGDYADQAHYLEANRLKETINKSADDVFRTINRSGIRLTSIEIEQAKRFLQNSIDEATSPTKK